MAFATGDPSSALHIKRYPMTLKYLLPILLIQSPILFADAAPETSEVLVKQVKGVVLLGPDASLLSQQELSEVEGVQIIDLQLPGSSKKLKKAIAQLLTEPELTTETVNQIQTTIKAFYTDNSHPFVLVQIPKQDITDGVLQIRVIESHVGDVIVVGNDWFSTRVLKQFLGLKTGDEIDQSTLLKNLHFINEDPFLRADVIFAPGTELYTTDLTMAVKERRPLRLYAGVDNTGIKDIGRNRWFMGVNWGNAFGLGHNLSYQYTASFNRHQFQGMTVQYLAPLTWHHLLNIYGGYAEVNPHLGVSHMSNHGWSCQASLRYQIPLPIFQYLEQDIIVGADYKRTNNTFEFSDESPSIGQFVNLTQLTLEYKGNYTGRGYFLTFDTSLFYSPFSWLPDQSNHDFRSLRRGAKHTWIYAMGEFSYLQKLPKSWTFYLLSRGQASSQNLLPSEQYGIGGFATVRGYEERQLNKDFAFLTTVEIRSPHLPVISAGCSSCKDSIQFLGFVDYGWGTDHEAEIPGRKTNYLWGIGPGIRYAYSEYLTARFDVGYKLKKQKFYDGGYAMIHFSIIGSY